jgi:hypothetical protein
LYYAGSKLEIKKFAFRRTMDLTVAHANYNYDYDLGQAVPSVPCAPPLGNYYNGTDDNPLILKVEIDDYKKVGYATSSIYFELSMDSDFAPDANVDPDQDAQSIAFGQYVAWGGSAAAKYYDGDKWCDTKYEPYDDPSLWPDKRFNIYTITIKSTTFDIELEAKKGLGVQKQEGLPRGYLGGFNQISIVAREAGGKPMYLDWVYLDGGIIEREPLPVDVDIMPADEINEFTVTKKGGGKLPIAIFGSEELPATDIDTTSVLVAGVSPVKASADTDVDGDGLMDLVVQVAKRDLIDALSLDAEPEDAVIDVEVTAARLGDGWPIEGMDSILIHQPPGQQ